MRLHVTASTLHTQQGFKQRERERERDRDRERQIEIEIETETETETERAAENDRAMYREKKMREVGSVLSMYVGDNYLS